MRPLHRRLDEPQRNQTIIGATVLKKKFWEDLIAYFSAIKRTA
jgi:hypothetical protein